MIGILFDFRSFILYFGASVLDGLGFEGGQARERELLDIDRLGPSCIPSNWNIYEPINHFSVAVPPMLSIPHQLVGAPLGYSVKLECYTEAHPTSLNYWTREDKHMIHDSNKYKVTSTPEVPSYKTHMTLEIYDIQV